MLMMSSLLSMRGMISETSNHYHPTMCGLVFSIRTGGGLPFKVSIDDQHNKWVMLSTIVSDPITYENWVLNPALEVDSNGYPLSAWNYSFWSNCRFK